MLVAAIDWHFENVPVNNYGMLTPAYKFYEADGRLYIIILISIVKMMLIKA